MAKSVMSQNICKFMNRKEWINSRILRKILQCFVYLKQNVQNMCIEHTCKLKGSERDERKKVMKLIFETKICAQRHRAKSHFVSLICRFVRLHAFIISFSLNKYLFIICRFRCVFFREMFRCCCRFRWRTPLFRCCSSFRAHVHKWLLLTFYWFTVVQTKRRAHRNTHTHTHWAWTYNLSKYELLCRSFFYVDFSFSFTPRALHCMLCWL